MKDNNLSGDVWQLVLSPMIKHGLKDYKNRASQFEDTARCENNQ